MKSLREQLRSARLISFANVARSIGYSRRRDAIDARFPFPAADATPRPAGALESAEPAPGGARFRFAAAELEVRFLAPDLLFAGWNGAGMLPSFAVAQSEWPLVDAELTRSDDGWSLKSGELELRVSAAGILRYFTASGRLLREEQPPVRKGEGWTQSSSLTAEEHIYGLGTRAAPLDRRRPGFDRQEGAAGSPVTYRFWNRDPGGAYGPGADPLYICMPVYLSLRDTECVLVFHDTTFDGSLTLGSDIRVSTFPVGVRYSRRGAPRFPGLPGARASPRRSAPGHRPHARVPDAHLRRIDFWRPRRFLR